MLVVAQADPVVGVFERLDRQVAVDDGVVADPVAARLADAAGEGDLVSQAGEEGALAAVAGLAASTPSSTTRSTSPTMKGSMLVPFTGIVTFLPLRSNVMTFPKKASLLTVIFSILSLYSIVSLTCSFAKVLKKSLTLPLRNMK